MNNYEKLNEFFEEVKIIGFWKRLFYWKSVRELSYDAYQQYKLLINELEHVADKIKEQNGAADLLKNDRQHLSESNQAFERSNLEFKSKIENLTVELSKLSEENTLHRQTEDSRSSEYEKKVIALNSAYERIENERNKERDKTNQMEIDRINSMKETWQRHEDDVKSFIKTICKKHSIEYVETVPFKGNPDNVIRLCGNYIIFDAKSPGSDDLSNFNTYIKTQTESVKKYIKEEGIKKELFLVIPSNSVEVITQFSYNVADYTVYIVTKDILEPLILSLRKIEDYEFANELSPEDRENICRLIGKFTYINKRRIQLDLFLMRESLDILSKRDRYLPEDMAEKTLEFEKAEKINLPQDRRARYIVTEELEQNFKKIQSKITVNEVGVSDSSDV